ncbi:Hypothetical protein, putative [Bodo saltans]|uniref:Uncharacterized protein n=1 Tax=Bodo saltans TaxID=75058 RepID=A0A0S4JLE8_BODSA|nr:Hypothetical protein, putative [Bodo saltans]|eukprot:CUG91426.1 Hypothetical protein, putative [Bodo saltans]
MRTSQNSSLPSRSRPQQPYDAASSRQQKQRQQELLGRMEQLADTLCEQFLHMAQDVATRGGTPMAHGAHDPASNIRIVGEPGVSGSQSAPPPLTSIRQYVEQMQFDLEEHQRVAMRVATRNQQLQHNSHNDVGSHRGGEYDFARRLSVGETSASTTTVPTIARHAGGGNSLPVTLNGGAAAHSFLPPVLQSQRLMATNNSDSTALIKGYSNAAPIQVPEGDLGVFDDTAGGRLRAAQQSSRRQNAQQNQRRYLSNASSTSPRGGFQKKHQQVHQDHSSQIVWTSELLGTTTSDQRKRAHHHSGEMFDPDDIDGEPLLHVPNYNAVRTMLSDEHGLKVGHIQPLLGSMHGHSFGLLDCMMDGNTRQLSSRRPPQLTEVEKRLRIVPDVTIGPSIASALNTDPQHLAAVSKLTPRFQRQREKERAVAIAMIMHHEQHKQQKQRGSSDEDPLMYHIPHPPPVLATAVGVEGDDTESALEEEDAGPPKLSPRDMVSQLATRRTNHRFASGKQ